ncbi:MAG: DNA adenine methylase, partial [Thermoplasmata archaeon]|nr:DNA adenine methylase [Thermoplasmata archaeon]
MTLNELPLKNDSSRRIEKEFPSRELSIIAERESWRKEIFRPIYHIHKWWAKRLGSVFRGIVLGALLNDDEDIIEHYYRRRDLSETVILDPFMGSGTTVGEALKLGCRAIGKDINPVSYQIVKTALEKDDLEDINCTYKKIERTVSNRITDYYLTELP